MHIMLANMRAKGKTTCEDRAAGDEWAEGMKGQRKNLWGIIYFCHKAGGFREDGYDLAVMADIIE